MKKYISIALIFLYSNLAFALETPNIETRFNELAMNSIKTLLPILNSRLSDSKLSLISQPNQASSIVKSNLLALDTLRKYYEFDKSDTLQKIEISLKQASSSYQELNSDSDSLIRKVDLKINFIARYKDKSEACLLSFEKEAADTIDRTSAEKYGKSSLDFLNSPIPEKKSSLFESSIEPILVILASGAIVFTFFSVRSKK